MQPVEDSSGSESSAKTILNIIEEIRANNIVFIFSIAYLQLYIDKAYFSLLLT
ncbi:hypothetical protein [Plasmodium yoelii yoelii]|uniref:Uncharacterized protein n=1 Tax=Plasmodium yoelii yoelii TaxID=73239 RepID=Q7RQU0_PLAYO|nr:hypothetical protein [Plasmodium yoelii yoelii]